MITFLLNQISLAVERGRFSPLRAATLIRSAPRTESEGYVSALIESFQNKRLRSVVHHVARSSPFYERMFAEAGITPRDIRTVKDLDELPFTTPSDIRRYQDFICVPEDQLSRVLTSSGTTGEPKQVYFSRRDIETIAATGAVGLRTALGVRRRDRVCAVIALPMTHGLWAGVATAMEIVRAAGGLCVPVGSDDPEEAIYWIKQLDPEVIITSPSYATLIAKQMEAGGGGVSLPVLILGGEALDEPRRAYLAAVCKAAIFESYGMCELGGGQCIKPPGCPHFHLNDLQMITEIVDPFTGEPADSGELVFTTLARDAMPLLRYRPGDRGRWVSHECRLPVRAIDLLPRDDGLMVTADANVHAGVIVEQAGKVEGLSGRCLFELDQRDLCDVLAITVERTPLTRDTARACSNGRDERELADAVRERTLGSYPELREAEANGMLVVECSVVDSLRDQIKTFRIIDRRPAAQVSG